jgi:transposase InsO family protein
MTLEDSIHSQRLRVLRDAERLGNVSEACRRHGVSRTLFYRLRRRLEQYGDDGVHPKRQQARRGRPPTVPVQTERRVIALALAWPTCGPQWYSDQLAREGVGIAPVTIWRLLRRQQLGTRRARLAVLERASAVTTGLLTERTAKPVRHVEAAQPGDLLSLDTFYVGKLKGVGKVWQITGCDVASSFGWARLIVGEVTAAAVLGFLREVVRPSYRHAGWRLQRVLTDNANEFQRPFFTDTIAGLGARHSRIKSGRPQTNGHVERLHRTILEECWRPVFARFLQVRYRGIQRELDAYTNYYNHHRAHTGRTTAGRCPADLVYGARKMEPR